MTAVLTCINQAPDFHVWMSQASTSPDEALTPLLPSSPEGIEILANHQLTRSP